MNGVLGLRVGGEWGEARRACSQGGVCFDSRLQLAGISKAATDPKMIPTITVALFVAAAMMSCSTARDVLPVESNLFAQGTQSFILQI